MEMPLRSGIDREEPFSFLPALEKEDHFNIRQAVERLREGLFDPVAVRMLTAHEERLKAIVERGFGMLDAGERPHLCVAGAYGQGKSHSLVYIQDLALQEGFATSLINLDPREVPFHNFRTVYRELMRNLRMPGANGSFPSQWKKWFQQRIKVRVELEGDLGDLFPAGMPHFFKAVLAAIALGNVSLSERERQSTKHAALRPKEFPVLLARALEGEAVPLSRLREVFKYRQVPFYKDASLSCRGSEPFLLMVQALSRLLRNIGCRGWVLLFDEAEAIAQAGVIARGKSYNLLHSLFAQDVSGSAFLYPVFAFTDDFFQRLSGEDFGKVRTRGETEIPYFELDYADKWRDLTIYRLEDLSRKEWEQLCRKLIRLHGAAYEWQPPEAGVAREMISGLDAVRTPDTRFKLKALVDCLDLVHQRQVLNL